MAGQLKHKRNTGLQVFIAGSKSIQRERTKVREILSHYQSIKNVRIDARTFEDFPDYMNKEGHQKAYYNTFIREKADVVIFVFTEHVGGKTVEEFYVAYDAYKEKQIPQILVFCDSKHIDKSQDDALIKIQEKMNELDLYYKDYDNHDQLANEITKNLDIALGFVNAEAESNTNDYLPLSKKKPTPSPILTPTPPTPNPKRSGWVKWCVGAIVLLVLGIVGINAFVKHQREIEGQHISAEQLHLDSLRRANEIQDSIRLVQEQAKKQAELKRLAKEQAKREAELKRLAEEQAKREAELKRLAEEQTQQEAAKQVKQEDEQKRLAEERAKREAQQQLEQERLAATKKTSGTINGHEYVDLGLPSGILWATCNIGTSTPQGYGAYFAWGETSKKSTYDWKTYKHTIGNSSTLNKYCTNSHFGTVDNKKILNSSDDAARVNWGGNWRIPTKAEIDELRTNCTWTWTTWNGVKGYNVKGPNGKSIFLPAAGYRNNNVGPIGGYYGVGTDGDYWSSSLYLTTPSAACSLYFSSGTYYVGNGTRSCGFPIRPVCSAQ